MKKLSLPRVEDLQTYAASNAAVYGPLFILVLCSPILLPVAFVVALSVLLWAIMFDTFKSKFSLTDAANKRELFPDHPEEATLKTPDGVTIRYYYGTRKGGTLGDGKVVLLCNPLGQKGVTSYYPVIAACVEAWGTDVTCIGWDYRGFFESDHPKRTRTLDVRNHAQDGHEVLKAVLGEGREVDLLVGHSMGVQVALEFALLYPEQVRAMVLLNGTFGHALQTAFQPLLKVPYVGDVLCVVGYGWPVMPAWRFHHNRCRSTSSQ
eukprot:TRINITY_DN18735_c0_g1_i1.p1 TRINITY_DN18735_c0_g1~~TRINITY_DN18735_c0_g1_i1.p1  ORF type:complete len:264 (-),score=32.92 TRINITY_DN18735_c0_g1_i1:750-1541(-)